MMPAIAMLLVTVVMQGLAAPPQPDLTLAVACSSRPDGVTLTIVNPSTADTAVLLGYALANGGRYLPRELVVEIKRSVEADFEALLYDDQPGLQDALGRDSASEGEFHPLRATDFAATTAMPRSLIGRSDWVLLEPGAPARQTQGAGLRNARLHR